jgi:hypothetical protein
MYLVPLVPLLCLLLGVPPVAGVFYFDERSFFMYYIPGSFIYGRQAYHHTPRYRTYCY